MENTPLALLESIALLVEITSAIACDVYYSYRFSLDKRNQLYRKGLAQFWMGSPCHQNVLLVPQQVRLCAQVC